MAIFGLFGAFSLCTEGAFLAIFPILLGFIGISGGTPIFLADLGAILVIFDHFGAIVGPFWGGETTFFAEKLPTPEK